MSKLGDGSRFKKVAEEAGGGKEGAAIAAIEGRKKYGESRMEKWSEAGKKKHELAKKMASKCETCGGGHRNHSSYTYRTGNV